MLVSYPNLPSCSKELIYSSVDVHELTGLHILAAHFETVLKVQDECPLLLAYSKGTGTGQLLENSNVHKVPIEDNIIVYYNIYSFYNREDHFLTHCTQSLWSR